MNNSKTVYLKDYTPSPYWAETCHLIFYLGEEKTRVIANMEIKRLAADAEIPLVLWGEDQALICVCIDEVVLKPTQYRLEKKSLTIYQVPEKCQLSIESHLMPQNNTHLSGLYRSKGLFCTQCEPEGFRRIMYSLDRSDVLTRFTTTVYADKRAYPVLLSNGNCLEKKSIDETTHCVTWQDPHPKPTYLFALVAGKLMSVRDHFLTQSGRLVKLELFVEPQNIDKTAHALAALKKAMIWDEKTYGREYDLDIYMIVAVEDFNMGAMENKGLNIFNAKYILARPETATDQDFRAIDAVVGHEYFHNWSGNRVTCRNWFQLSLKEGLTVFREQHFSRDISRSPVALIHNVRLLRAKQFSEDASALAHPVRPSAYQQINNFYTMTVYEKGAEVIRMLQTLLGQEMFRKGLDHYFSTYDGKAVAIEEFILSFETVSGEHLSQFMRWYDQAGTPVLSVSESYDPKKQIYALHFKQTCPPTPGQSEKAPFLIPIAVGLLDKTGNEILPTQVLRLSDIEQTFEFSNITEKPIPSILRDFSAPVKLESDFLSTHYPHCLAYDTNDFNRFEAGYGILKNIILACYEKPQNDLSDLWTVPLKNIYEDILMSQSLSKELISEIYTLPSLEELSVYLSQIDMEKLFTARFKVKQFLARAFKDTLKEIYFQNHPLGQYEYTPESVAMRRLKNCALDLLLCLDVNKNAQMCSLALEQFYNVGDMTDKIGALKPLSHLDTPERAEAFKHFYEKYAHEPLVVNKWLTLQATSHLPNTLDMVQNLLHHSAFDLKNPNKVYALIGGFCAGNPYRFHDKTARGYQFLQDRVIELDVINPEVAARIIQPLCAWQRFVPALQVKMKSALETIGNTPNLSSHVAEIVEKSLK